MLIASDVSLSWHQLEHFRSDTRIQVCIRIPRKSEMSWEEEAEESEQVRDYFFVIPFERLRLYFFLPRTEIAE